MIPKRKYIISSLVAAGSTALGIIRWLYGHWMPSLSTIVRSPWFVAYVAISALIGAAVTYYFDDQRNEKLNNINVHLL
jgi:membrane protein YqaA with SNARE-associated domain